MDTSGTDGGAHHPGRGGFFSLKWKALLLTSLVLVVVTVAISLRSYVNLTRQFDYHQHSAHARYVEEVAALIDQSLNRLRQLGSMIPSLPDLQAALRRGDPQGIRQALQPQLPVLQIDLGIDVVGFFGPAGRLLTGWDATTWSEEQTRRTLAWVEDVYRPEQPLVGLYCRPLCLQYALVPILADGESIGAVLVGSSLADVVRGLRQVSGNDIGLLASTDDSLDTPHRLPHWAVTVVALTESERNLPVLAAAGRRFTLAEADAGVRVELKDRTYEIRLIPLPNFTGTEAARLVVIVDITATLAEIRAATREIFSVGIGGWLLAEVLLLAVLWRPMSRLRVTADTLPLLAQRRFQTVRDAVAAQSRSRMLRDETDVLGITTAALADRLEGLENDVEERNRALSRRMAELAAERDFIASLLNTAQVIILTQDRQGRILMANPFAHSLTGFCEAELRGRSYIDLLFPERLADLDQRLADLVAGRQEHLRHDSLVSCKDGGIVNVTWYHSALAARTSDDPAILSVGLDVTERQRAESRVAWLADHDALTGLLNRRRFQEELELVLTAAKRQHKTGALLFIDLDQFKYINDTSGHHSGDALLKVVAGALSGTLVAADVVARLGGDEFAVLMREADAEAAGRMAATINDSLSRVGFAVAERTLRISASIGIALFPTHGDNVDDLMACADLAMYQAKDAGRGHWHLFSEEDKTRERMRDRVYWKDKVSQALAEDRFLLYLQPIMEIASGRVSHYEVLLRMQDADGTIISAVNFIEAAERSGMIHAVDRLVLSKAVRCLAEARRRGLDVSFAINLSGHVFNDPQILPYIQAELRQHPGLAARIIFEITETAAVSDFAVANNLMLAIRELGCHFALDDFGIGFSSFYYLKHLPVDYLKIDGSFIRQLPDKLDDQIIVRALSQVASGFGKKTIAEFVESAETLELLRVYGIDYAQGYHISKPASAEALLPQSASTREQRLISP
ncbi:MAG: EAL domain-containing protein [Pseudomonadota bacterium]|nr:EAL domain-containing protein [Pseudomonadota bacterium]